MLRKLLFTLLIFLYGLTALAQQPFTCKGQFFMTKFDGLRTSLLEVVIDPVTQRAVFDVIKTLPGVSLNAIGFRSTDNLIYALNTIDQTLVQYDAVGDAFVLGALDLADNRAYLGADISPDGRFMYMMETFMFQDRQVPVDENLLVIDLEDPNLAIQRIPIFGDTVKIFDIAFDPRNGELFGYDSKGQRLVRMDPSTGEVLNSFPPNPNVPTAGSLFFDAFGNLFAYGYDGVFDALENPGEQQNALFAVNKQTGVLTKLTSGDLAEATDACTCPYTVQMNKFVEPRDAISCTKVLYFFEIASLSMFTQEGLTFIDDLPEGFTFVEVIENPFGGTVESVSGDSEVRIRNMTVEPGLDTIVVEVFINGVSPGTYANQARITGLDESLGQTTVSDDPATLVKFDSTRIMVEEFVEMDTITFREAICVEEGQLTLDPSRFGSNFVWEDNSTDAMRTVTMAGQYYVQASNACGTFNLLYDISNSEIDISASPAFSSIIWGDTIDINVTVESTHEPYTLHWTDPLNGSISCLRCSNPAVFPDFDVVYLVEGINDYGCRDIDSVKVEVDRNYFYYIPNAFTPNGDETNETFFVQGSRNGRVKKLQIFDKWGNKIYDIKDANINNPNEGWDGTTQNTNIQPGMYIYVADLLFLNEIEVRETGDLYLLK